MKPAFQLKNSEILQRIETLASNAYRALSRFHSERLEELREEAKRRKLKI